MDKIPIIQQILLIIICIILNLEPSFQGFSSIICNDANTSDRYTWEDCKLWVSSSTTQLTFQSYSPSIQSRNETDLVHLSDTLDNGENIDMIFIDLTGQGIQNTKQLFNIIFRKAKNVTYLQIDLKGQIQTGGYDGLTNIDFDDDYTPISDDLTKLTTIIFKAENNLITSTQNFMENIYLRCPNLEKFELYIKNNLVNMTSPYLHISYPIFLLQNIDNIKLDLSENKLENLILHQDTGHYRLLNVSIVNIEARDNLELKEVTMEKFFENTTSLNIFDLDLTGSTNVKYFYQKDMFKNSQNLQNIFIIQDYLSTKMEKYTLNIEDLSDINTLNINLKNYNHSMMNEYNFLNNLDGIQNLIIHLYPDTSLETIDIRFMNYLYRNIKSSYVQKFEFISSDCNIDFSSLDIGTNIEFYNQICLTNNCREDQFFDSQRCQQCSSECVQCASNIDYCVICPDNLVAVKQDNTQSCQNCSVISIYCTECNQDGTCTKCNNGGNPEKDCRCDRYHYSNLSDFQAKEISQECLTECSPMCETCKGSFFNVCETCNSDMGVVTLDDGKCACEENMFFSIQAGNICVSCDQGCSWCQNKRDFAVSLKQQEIQSCECNDNFYSEFGRCIQCQEGMTCYGLATPPDGPSVKVPNIIDTKKNGDNYILSMNQTVFYILIGAFSVCLISTFFMIRKLRQRLKLKKKNKVEPEQAKEQQEKIEQDKENQSQKNKTDQNQEETNIKLQQENDSKYNLVQNTSGNSKMINLSSFDNSNLGDKDKKQTSIGNQIISSQQNQEENDDEVQVIAQDMNYSLVPAEELRQNTDQQLQTENQISQEDNEEQITRKRQIRKRKQPTKNPNPTLQQVKNLDEFDQKYEKQQIIGRGMFGKVYQIQDKESKKIYAVKQIKTDDKQENNIIKQELDIYKYMSLNPHPNITNALDMYYGEIPFQNNNLQNQIQYKYYIVMEKGDCNLLELMNKKIQNKEQFSQQEITQILKQSILALDYLSKYNICHRDIKPQNIIIMADSTIKFTDLGVSKINDNINQIQTQYKSLSMAQGTPCYMSPEMYKKMKLLQELPYDQIQKTKFNINYLLSDIYSLGLTILQLQNQLMLIDLIGINCQESMEILNNQLEKIHNLQLKEIMQGMLQFDFNQRDNLQSIQQKLDNI